MEWMPSGKAHIKKTQEDFEIKCGRENGYSFRDHQAYRCNK
jgi:hypothetical protein